MIEAIGISRNCLEKLKTDSATDELYFQWQLPNLNRVSIFNTDIEDSLKEIRCWFKNITDRKFTPILLLTKSESERLQDKLSSSIQFNIFPEVEDPLFDRVLHDMQGCLYAPDKLLTRRWINWKRLGILPSKGAAEEYPEEIWEAYGKGLHDWFDANKKERHPMAARSLFFMPQEPVNIEQSEVDLPNKKRERDGTVTFSPIDLPFVRFRLVEQEGHPYQLVVVLGPMVDQELEEPSPDLVSALKRKPILDIFYKYSTHPISFWKRLQNRYPWRNWSPAWAYGGLGAMAVALLIICIIPPSEPLDRSYSYFKKQTSGQLPADFAWESKAVRGGGNPEVESDREQLQLAFLYGLRQGIKELQGDDLGKSPFVEKFPSSLVSCAGSKAAACQATQERFATLGKWALLSKMICASATKKMFVGDHGLRNALTISPDQLQDDEGFSGYSRELLGELQKLDLSLDEPRERFCQYIDQWIRRAMEP